MCLEASCSARGCERDGTIRASEATHIPLGKRVCDGRSLGDGHIDDMARCLGVSS